MKLTLSSLFLLTLAATANPVLVRETGPLTPDEEHKGLKVPEGFEIQLFAAEPMINKPINLAYDGRGRIWVSSNVEYPYAAKKDRWVDAQGSKVRGSRDAIKILEDTNGDGKADKVTNFADGLNIPTGVLPWHKPEHKDGCIAWSIPNIWYFADTTGDGVADHREVLFGPLGYERDTHGMCSSFRLGPDGWVYATHGFNNTSKAVARDGSTVEMNSGNVFRFQPDGSRIEVWSRGQVNPFGLCFDRRGNLYSADCHSSPVYQLIRGAFYPSFGKPHDGMGFGPAMIEHTHGSTGICGIVYLDRGVWGAEWNDHLLIGNPVTSRVNHDRVKFTGSTPSAIEQQDFITSDDLWFRPVDLCLGGDGALYVADFYNKIIGHYEVPLEHPGRDRERGRIWRVVKKDGASPRGKMEIPVVSAQPVDDLRSSSPFVQRAAAASLQLNPRMEALPVLLDLLQSVPAGDTHLRHVVRLALREHMKLPGAFRDLKGSPALLEFALAVASQDAAGYLLQQLKGAPQESTSTELALRTHIARNGTPQMLNEAIAFDRHRELNALTAAGWLGAYLRGLEERGVISPHPELLSWALALAPVILQGGVESWTAAPHPAYLKSTPPWVLQDRQCGDGKAARVLSSLPIGAAQTEVLTGVLRSEAFAAPAKFSFWICGHRGAPDQPAHEKNLVRLVESASGKELRQAFPPRSDVCEQIEWDLSDLQGKLVQLEIVDGDNAGAYAWLGITRIEPALISVDTFQGSDARSAAMQQLAALLKVTAPVDLRDRLRPYLPASPAPAPVAVTKEERARLDTLIRERAVAFTKATADPARGANLFETHCAVCHQLAGKGALLGPQLNGIGARGVERLCEDILDPNRNVDAHFYLTTFHLKDGSAAAGFVRAESGAVTLLVDAAGKEQRIAKNTVASTQVTPLSLMPPTFEKVLAPAEFNDLLAWLLTQK